MEKKKVLIVDDEKDVLTVLEKRLSLAGYSVISADNGADALTLAKTHRPDLVILDIMMPGMDGGQTAYALSETPETKNIPVIFLTCLLRKEEQDKTSSVISGKYFIAKPYNPDELLKEIKKHISG